MNLLITALVGAISAAIYVQVFIKINLRNLKREQEAELGKLSDTGLRNQEWLVRMNVPEYGYWAIFGESKVGREERMSDFYGDLGELIADYPALWSDYVAQHHDLYNVIYLRCVYMPLSLDPVQYRSHPDAEILPSHPDEYKLLTDLKAEARSNG